MHMQYIILLPRVNLIFISIGQASARRLGDERTRVVVSDNLFKDVAIGMHAWLHRGRFQMMPNGLLHTHTHTYIYIYIYMYIYTVGHIWHRFGAQYIRIRRVNKPNSIYSVLSIFPQHMGETMHQFL